MTLNVIGSICFVKKTENDFKEIGLVSVQFFYITSVVRIKQLSKLECTKGC